MSVDFSDDRTPSLYAWEKQFARQVAGFDWKQVVAATALIAEARTNLASRFNGIVSEIADAPARYDTESRKIVLDIPADKQTHFIPTESGVIVRRAKQTIIDPFNKDFPDILQRACESKGLENYGERCKRLLSGHEGSLILP